MHAIRAVDRIGTRWAVEADLSSHQDLLDLSKRRVLGEPLSLRAVLRADRGFDVGVCDRQKLLFTAKVSQRPG